MQIASWKASQCLGFPCLIDGPGLVVEAQHAEVGEGAEALEIVEERGVEGEPLDVRAQFGDELQVVGREQLHRLEEHGLQAEPREHHVWNDDGKDSIL